MNSNLKVTVWDDINNNKLSIELIPYYNPFIKPGIRKTKFLIKQFFEALGLSYECLNLDPYSLIFINYFYRKLLRVHLEIDFQNKNIEKGSVFTTYENSCIDICISRALRNIRIICRHLGLDNSFTEAKLSVDKLLDFYFWSKISENFIEIYGEEYSNTLLILGDDNVNGDGKCDQNVSKVVRIINTIFYLWSGSQVFYDNNSDLYYLCPNKSLKNLLKFL